MSPVLMPLLVAIATVGVAMVAALTIGLFAWLRSDMRRLEDRLVSRIEQGEARLASRIEQMETRLAAVEYSQAKLEGLLEGLREAIVARAA